MTQGKEEGIWIVQACRTALGAYMGRCAPLAAQGLLAGCLQAVLKRSGLDAQDLGGAWVGQVFQEGLGPCPARQAALMAHLPEQMQSMVINQGCLSSLAALSQALEHLRQHPESSCLVGGVESVSNAPYLLNKARGGLRIGHQPLLDPLFHDALEDGLTPGKPLGLFAEQHAEVHHLDRSALDNFALDSVNKAKQAQTNHYFDAEIVPITLKMGDKEHPVAEDELPQRVRIDKIHDLKPMFQAGGRLTAANCAALVDGAAALALCHASYGHKHRLTPLARVAGMIRTGVPAAQFLDAPRVALEALLNTMSWSVADVGAFEIHENYACVPLAISAALGIPANTLNRWGGACALGHPLGAAGVRMITTLAHMMAKEGLQRGVVVMGAPGGEATAVALERDL